MSNGRRGPTMGRSGVTYVDVTNQDVRRLLDANAQVSDEMEDAFASPQQMVGHVWEYWQENKSRYPALSDVSNSDDHAVQSILSVMMVSAQEYEDGVPGARSMSISQACQLCDAAAAEYRLRKG